MTFAYLPNVEFSVKMMKYSVDLEKESLKELRFLAVVAKHKGLLDPGNLLKWAIYRYTFSGLIVYE